MQQIELQHVSKQFQSAPVLHDVSLSVARGTFLALLGPSGCGKTTLLRLIAGLERPTAGTIALAGRTVAGPGAWVGTEARNLGMVFQSYALWPHMSVAENVGFGLAVRGVSRRERGPRIDAALTAVGMNGLGGRRPSELSGGQRQRAALARCLVTEPDLILLDEPLANLDPHLRLQMQTEFRRIHRETGTTFVFVTHDQVEAMALADQVAVMNTGRIEQLAAPAELYRRPRSEMVAEFFGKGVVLPAQVVGQGAAGRLRVELAGLTLDLPGDAPPGKASVSLRPEDLSVAPAGSGLAATVIDTRYRGGDYLVLLALDAFTGKTVEIGLPTSVPAGTALALDINAGWVFAPAAT